jgi:predicted SAM-dependent methyltransferase
MQRAHRRSVRKAGHLIPPLKLHIGYGTDLKPGWVNMDLLEATADLQLDLREGLPFPTASVTIIHSEHEHLDFADQVDQLLRESYRVLVPHGAFSVGIPEAGGPSAPTSAGSGEREVFAAQWNPDYPEWFSMPMHRINYLFRQFGEHEYASTRSHRVFDTLAPDSARGEYRGITLGVVRPVLNWVTETR